VRLVRHAAPQHLAEDRRRAEDAARGTEGIACRIALQLRDVAGRNLVERDRVDEEQALDALGPGGREPQRDRAPEVDADDGGLGESQRGERAVDELRLRGDAEVRVERPVGLAVAEQVDRERGAVRQCDLGRDVPPEEARRAEPVDQDDGRSAVAVALDVNRPWPDRDAQQISVDEVRPPERVQGGDANGLGRPGELLQEHAHWWSSHGQG